METDRGENWIGNYEIEIREPGKDHGDPKLTLRWQVSSLHELCCNLGACHEDVESTHLSMSGRSRGGQADHRIEH